MVSRISLAMVFVVWRRALEDAKPTALGSETVDEGGDDSVLCSVAGECSDE